MNFDDIKKSLEDESTEAKIPESIAAIKKSEMPIQKIRSNMKMEIFIQLFCIFIIFCGPLVVDMTPLSESIYYILLFLTSLITAGYLLKMVWFLSKTSFVKVNTRDTLINFIHDLEITLEVYKTAIIAGSLLLPIPAAGYLFAKSGKSEVFEKWLLLDLEATSILLIIFAYILIAWFFYIVTVIWSNSLYGKYINKLKEILTILEE